MEEKKQNNFFELLWDLYLNAETGDTGEMSQELEETGINVEESEQRVLRMIKKAKAEVRLAKGREFKEKFKGLLENLKKHPGEIEVQNPELAMAFRKLSASEKPDLNETLDEQEKLSIMEYLKKEMDKKS